MSYQKYSARALPTVLGGALAMGLVIASTRRKRAADGKVFCVAKAGRTTARPEPGPPVRNVQSRLPENSLQARTAGNLHENQDAQRLRLTHVGLKFSCENYAGLGFKLQHFDEALTARADACGSNAHRKLYGRWRSPSPRAHGFARTSCRPLTRRRTLDRSADPPTPSICGGSGRWSARIAYIDIGSSCLAEMATAGIMRFFPPPAHTKALGMPLTISSGSKITRPTGLARIRPLYRRARATRCRDTIFDRAGGPQRFVGCSWTSHVFLSASKSGIQRRVYIDALPATTD